MSKVIIFPTDTVYGIGCSIFDVKGIERIYAIKHRNKEKPLACLCASLEQIEEIAQLDTKARKLIQKFMPGALTLILPAKPEVTNHIGYKTIGVRIPNASLAIQILTDNGPMLTTSVNESGNVPLNNYEEILKDYGSLVEQIYPPQEVSSNVASTVLDLSQNELKILREGAIKLQDILNAL